MAAAKGKTEVSEKDTGGVEKMDGISREQLVANREQLVRQVEQLRGAVALIDGLLGQLGGDDGDGSGK